MKNLIMPGLFLVMLLFITSCSQQEGLDPKSNNSNQPMSSQEESASTTNTQSIENQPGTVTKGKLVESSLTYSVKSDGIEFHFKVKNSLDHPQTLHFKTLQRYDYILKSSNGTVVKQLSKEQPNPKLPSEEFLKPKGELNYTGTIKNLSKGAYSITFILLAKEEPAKVSLKFTIH
ncbi:BsuPI-related putative proteinase inhibitor [Neobacillus sp. SuZ13]|uniref:BsuPI-related putative proteinase inhibitor n=1 Tax=Neobacillus sp. SuZ13 TaxID=3047875 RepID=UPI0024BFC7B7|nr:BsuPI-related putative proteinase inhibitor [Neobacillus sp. SuZ13]WHY67055.1 BsuPI-related putative proteinase inhibitor [Neobacillus sp. SuZ13]